MVVIESRKSKEEESPSSSYDVLYDAFRCLPPPLEEEEDTLDL